MIEQAIPEKTTLPKDQTSLSSIENLAEKLHASHSKSTPEIENKIVKTIYKLPIEKVAPLSMRENIKRALTLDSNYICYINQENSITIKSIEYAFLNSTITVTQSRVLDINLLENTNFSLLGIIFDDGSVSGYRIELSDSKATIYTQKVLSYHLEGIIEKPQLMWKDSGKLGVAIKNELTLIDLNTEKGIYNNSEENCLLNPRSFKVLRFDQNIKDYGFSTKYSLVYLLFENHLVQVLNTDNGVKIREFIPHVETNSRVVKLLSFKNLAKQDPINLVGQKIEINKDRDYSLKDIFITLTEECEVKVWDLSEWDKEKKTYYCIETFQLSSPLNEFEIVLKFCFFDPVKNFLFIVGSKNMTPEICVAVMKINHFFQKYQDNFKEKKKNIQFFESLEKIEFEEPTLISIAALNSTKNTTQEELTFKDKLGQTNINFSTRSSRTQAKFNFLIRNDIFTSFLSVFDPQLPENIVRRERSVTHLNAIIDGSNESPRSKSLRFNKEYNPMQLAWEPRNLNKILSGVQLGFPFLENNESKRKQSYEEHKKQDLNKSFVGSTRDQSSQLLKESEKNQNLKPKKYKNRKKVNNSLVEPFVPGDKELEDYQNFVKRESQALLEQLNKSEQFLVSKDTNASQENENRVSFTKEFQTLEQISKNNEEDKFAINSTFEGVLPNKTKIEHEKNISPEISMEMIENLVIKKISELKMDSLEDKIKKEIEERINNDLAKAWEKKIESQLENYTQQIYAKVNLSFENERNFYLEKLASQEHEFKKVINETQNKSTHITNIISQALARSLEKLQEFENKFLNKCSELDQFILKVQRIFQGTDLQKRIESLEKSMIQISKIIPSKTLTNLTNQNLLQTGCHDDELTNPQRTKKKEDQEGEITQNTAKLDGILLLQGSLNNSNLINLQENLKNEMPRVPYPWVRSLQEEDLPMHASDMERPQESLSPTNNFPNFISPLDHFPPDPNLIQQSFPEPPSNLPPGLLLVNENFSMKINKKSQSNQNKRNQRYSFDQGLSFMENKFPTKSRLNHKHLEFSGRTNQQSEDEKLQSNETLRKSTGLNFYKGSQASYEDLLPKDLLQEEIWDEF